jgi:hypothetical protein
MSGVASASPVVNDGERSNRNPPAVRGEAELGTSPALPATCGGGACSGSCHANTASLEKMTARWSCVCLSSAGAGVAVSEEDCLLSLAGAVAAAAAVDDEVAIRPNCTSTFTPLSCESSRSPAGDSAKREQRRRTIR